MQSTPEAFDESRLVITILTIWELQKRDARVIKIRVLRNVFSKQFCFAEDKRSWPLNRGGIADLSLLRTLLTIRQKF